MASLQTQTINGHLGGGHLHGHAKITKARSRQTVKPILRKLQSHSEKNSLDLDRGWDEQTQFGYSSYSPGVDEEPVAISYPAIATTKGHISRARDVSFSVSSTDLSNGPGPRPSKYSHARSTSGTSHVSVATTGSGRNGSFVHPFQQTPQTSTLPLAYANSIDAAAPRDYSPTITENEDNGEYHYQTSRPHPPPHSHSRPRRPSLASQRTSSVSDLSQPMRITADRRTNSSTASRITQRIVTKSRSDLHLNAASATALDSASSATTPMGSFVTPQMMAASASSAALSPLRSSLDMNGFRLRSRSEVDSVTHQEQVREARRKFEEKEKAKEEKYAREQIRKRERADNREAHRMYKTGRKSSFGQSRISCDRNSSKTDIRPTISRKNTGTIDSSAEKLAFASRGYDTVPLGQTPHARTDAIHFESTKRSTTKRKTTGAWTAFVLWLRTRLLKLGRR